MIEFIQENINPRSLILLLVSIILLTLTAAYFYLFKSQLVTYQQKQCTLQLLQEESSRGTPIDTEIVKIKSDIESLNQRLRGSGPRLPVNQMIPYVIGRLDLIADNHDVKLISVKPGDSMEILMFKEIPFHIEINGSYFDLFSWLHETETELGPMIVKQFTIKLRPPSNELTMNLVMVAYQQEDS